jgi:hypothetical protein
MDDMQIISHKVKRMLFPCSDTLEGTDQEEERIKAANPTG